MAHLTHARTAGLTLSSSLAALLFLALPLACNGPDPLSEGDLSAAITTDEAVARAESWVQAGLLYCQAPNHGWDPVCGYTCNRASNAAWDEPTSATTAAN